uniref:Uncharacterized protein n=1 Tax=Cucumis melo TaxID=3656 RepID=A0A9I9EKP5_CUCME
MSHRDEPQLLQTPPEKYSFIKQNHWEKFVRSRLFETFQILLGPSLKHQSQFLPSNAVKVILSKVGYKLKEDSNEVYLNQAKMWKKAQVNKQGQYDNDDVQQVVHKIDEILMNTDSSSVNRHYLNDVLTQALGTKEHNSHVRRVGGYVTLAMYFYSVKKTSKDEANIVLDNEKL